MSAARMKRPYIVSDGVSSATRADSAPTTIIASFSTMPNSVVDGWKRKRAAVARR